MCFGPGPESPEALAERFNEYLARAVVDGRGGTHCGSWFDKETQFALSAVAAAFPDPSPALIAEARASFDRQLDGTHAAEREAEWDAWASAYGSTWPESSPFALSVTATFEHILRFIARPAEYEEAEATRTKLHAARAHTAGNPRRELIVEQLEAMIDELDVIPDYDIPCDSRPGVVEEFGGCAKRALDQLVKAAEAEPDARFHWAPVELNRAARCRPPSTRWRRDFGIILERLRLILAGLETGCHGQ